MSYRGIEVTKSSNGMCTNLCPFGKRLSPEEPIRVGSMACGECDEFQELQEGRFNYSKDYILCRLTIAKKV